MPLLTWTEEYSVNHSRIDDQHKTLFDLLNTLHASMLERTDPKKLAGVVDELVNYTKYHFTTEENILAEKNFPHLKKHQQEHEKFVQKITEIKERIERTNMVLSLEVLLFMQDWIKNHVLTNDKKYAPYL